MSFIVGPVTHNVGRETYNVGRGLWIVPDNVGPKFSLFRVEAFIIPVRYSYTLNWTKDGDRSAARSFEGVVG